MKVPTPFAAKAAAILIAAVIAGTVVGVWPAIAPAGSPSTWLPSWPASSSNCGYYTNSAGHGHFGAWLGAEFQMSVSTAERYIRIAEVLAGKIVTVTNLSPTSLNLLAAKSTPEPVREEIIGRLNSGEVIPNDDIKHRIQEAKAAAADAAKQAAMKPRQRRYRARIQADQERQRQESAHQAAERQAAAGAAVQFLVDRLGERFPEFVELFDRASYWEFEKALRSRSGAGDIAPPASEPAAPSPASPSAPDDGGLVAIWEGGLTPLSRRDP